MAKIYSVKNSVNLWARWTVPGYPEQRKTTGVATKRLAQIKADEMQREDIERRRLESIGIVTFDEMQAWDVERAKTAETNEEEWKCTIPTYWKHVKSYFKCPSEVNAKSVGDYIAYRRSQLIGGKRQPSNVSIRHELRVMKRGIRLAEIHDRDAGLDKRTHHWPILRKKDSQKLKTQSAELRHTREQVVQWIATLQGAAQAETLFALLTGMRAYELKRCTLDMLEENEGIFIFHVPGRKNGPSLRNVALTPFSVQLVRRFLPFKHNHDRARQYAAKRLGFDDWLHPPSLRNMRGLFVTVAHEGKFSDSVIKAVSAHGAAKDSHMLYLGANLSCTARLEIATYIENYWAPRLAAAFLELGNQSDSLAIGESVDIEVSL